MLEYDSVVNDSVPYERGERAIDRQERIRSLINQVRLLNRAMRHQARCEGGDISMAQLSMLRIVEEHGVVRPVDLAHHAGLSASSVTGLLDRLEAGGLVQRLRRQEDRREVEVRLTDAGQSLLTDLHDSLFTELVELFAPLDDGELATLETIVAKLVRR